MSILTDSNASIHDRLNYISSRLIIMSLNIHIELNDGHFSLSRSNEIRKHSDLSLVSSSSSNTLINELITCIEYYCNEINQLSDALRLIINSSFINIQILDDLSKGSQLCLNILHNYHIDRNQAVQSMLLSPYREDAWYVVNEIDLNIFGKCRIILIRLRIYFLLMHQILTNNINGRQLKIKKQESNLSLLNKIKHERILDFKV